MLGVLDVICVLYKIWGCLQNKYWCCFSLDLLIYGLGVGYVGLCEQIVEYLWVVCLVNCMLLQVFIIIGIYQFIDIVVKLLGEYGDMVWVEDLCYWGICSVFNLLGIQLVLIVVDQEGMCMCLVNLC